MKFRLTAFLVAIGGMLALIGWTAQRVWLRAGLLHDNLSDVQLQSFKLADHIQQSVLDLNKIVFRFALSRDTNDWAQFEKASKDLDDWIDLQRRNEPTAREVSIHDLI